jgi:hypothetical protein
MSEWFKEIVLKIIVYYTRGFESHSTLKSGRNAVVACLFWVQEVVGSNPTVPNY